MPISSRQIDESISIVVTANCGSEGSAAKEDHPSLLIHLFGISLLDDRASHNSISLQHYGLLLSDSVGPGYWFAGLRCLHLPCPRTNTNST